MIKIVQIFIIAVLVSASIPFIGTTAYINLSAQDKKTEISNPEKSSIDNKSSASEFAPAALENKTKQEEQILIKVAAVILVIWAGISFFLFHIERKLKKIEDSLKD
jgi:mannitol-specific phosphotransferase system IIBC component